MVETGEVQLKNGRVDWLQLVSGRVAVWLAAVKRLLKTGSVQNKKA